ncbi:MAG: hypothetical protein PF447_10665 [Spirochaetaceae bacterium]|jgi:hypothetical protein|nr:hypothetical protein [Spirochaetaceae bacterium]
MNNSNRRSERNKRERHTHIAQTMLDSFHWEWDQRFLLELVATGEIPIDQIRELRWNQLRQGFKCLIILDKEMNLPEEVFDKIQGCFQEEVDLLGDGWKTPEDKLFSHQTSKDMYKEIISFKG